ncbi:MAG: cytochrome P450 [Salibaculum sp.]|uniref:cytochrome P450 n=1 Tax=Roseovarius halophilus (ex Wu et al. 2025) TaxID=3376060 RepID=UPI0028709958|nr:cytochrome P450 [Salibaculum sp.]MDR9428136.1 cytochrome P450 [Salibaculum sp.]MDR9481858.1 cytochrome P450 [Salibaculum sp.]
MKPDLHAQEVLRDPAPLIDDLQRQGRLVRLKLPILGPVWATTTHADSHQVLGDADTFCRNPVTAGNPPPERFFWWAPRFIHPLFRNVTMLDGAEHARLRRLAAPGFSSIGIDRVRPKLEQIVETLLDALPTDWPVDLVTHYNRRLPLLAICEVLGIPEADRARVIRWVTPVGSVASVPGFFRAVPGLWRLSRHFRADFERIRQAGGREGLIGDLVQVHDGDPETLSDDELLAMVVALFIGGFDTTTHLIGNAISTLLQAPDLRADLQARPEAWPRFIEEVMRFHSPVMFTNAFHVTRPVTLGGQALQRGDRVVPLLIAANRDGAQAPCPHAFEADRKPNRHIGFGYGSHICMGMQLARTEAQIATRALFDRFPDAQLTEPAEGLPMLKRLGLRGTARLPVRLAP